MIWTRRGGISIFRGILFCSTFFFLTMPHVAVYQGTGSSTVHSGPSTPQSHMGLSLFVMFCVNPPLGEYNSTLENLFPHLHVWLVNMPAIIRYSLLYEISRAIILTFDLTSLGSKRDHDNAFWYCKCIVMVFNCSGMGAANSISRDSTFFRS